MVCDRQGLEAMLANALSEALGSLHGQIDYEADLEDSGLDSLRLSSALLAFEELIGEEIPMDCIDELAEARTLGRIREVLMARYLVEG